MHEHKFVIGEFGAFCMEAECMYAFSARDIAKILADIANSVSAQQSVQADGVCTCPEYINEPMTTAFRCAFCGKPPRQ